MYTTHIFCSENNLLRHAHQLAKTDQHRLLTCYYCINRNKVYEFGVLLKIYVDNSTQEKYFSCSDFCNQVTSESRKFKHYITGENIKIFFLKTSNGKEVPAETYCNMRIFNQNNKVYFALNKVLL